MQVTLAQCEWVTIYVLLPRVAATRSVLCKKMFLEISENLQEHTCVLFNKVADSGTGVFLWILRNV